MDPLRLQVLCCKSLISRSDASTFLLSNSLGFSRSAMEDLIRVAVEHKDKELVFLGLLRKWPYTYLNLSGMKQLDEWWAHRICKALKEQSPESKLKALDISFCPTGHRGVRALLECFQPEPVSENNYLGLESFLQSTISYFTQCQSQKTPDVKLIMDLYVDELNYDVIFEVLKSGMVQITSLIAEALKANRILKLIPLLKDMTLLKVDLSMNGLRNEGAAVICQALASHFRNLRILDLSYNGISDRSEGVSALKALLQAQEHLEHLDLSANRFGALMPHVLGAIASQRVSVLKLSFCGLNGLDFCKLSQLSFIPVLQELHIDGNNLKRDIAEVMSLLATVGERNGNLNVLNLREAKIGTEELNQLLPYLCNLERLKWIFVSGFTEAECQYFESRLRGVKLNSELEE